MKKRKYINNEKYKKKDSLIYAASSLQCFSCNVTINSASLYNQNYLFLTKILLPCSLLQLTSLTLNKIVLSLCTCYPLTESTLHYIEIRIKKRYRKKQIGNLTLLPCVPALRETLLEKHGFSSWPRDIKGTLFGGKGFFFFFLTGVRSKKNINIRPYRINKKRRNEVLKKNEDAKRYCLVYINMYLVYISS